MIRCNSQSNDPGNFPDTKPTWPPESGDSNVTESESSASVGSADAGRNGSFCALIINVGTQIFLSQGLLLALVQ